MIKLYSAISGRKSKLIGEGKNVIEAIHDAGLTFNDGVDTDEQMEDYVRGARQDYVIEEVPRF